MMRWPIKSSIFIFAIAVANNLAAQSSPFFDSLYTVFSKAKTDSAKLLASFEIIEHLQDYQLDEQKMWVDTTAEFAARLPGHKLTYKRQLFLANWNRMSGNFREGYELAILSAQKYHEMGDNYFECTALFEAGTSLAEFNPKAAIGVLNNAVELGRKIGDEPLTARCLTNLAYAMELAKLNNTNEYRQTLEAALEVFNKIGNIDGVLINNFNLVEYYARKRYFERARQSVADMRAMLNDETDEVYEMYPLVAEGNILMAEGRYQQALANYEKGWRMLEEYEIMDGQMELYPTIIKAYESVGDFKQAYLFSQGFQAMKDSIFSSEKNKTVQQLQTRYETEKKEAQIAMQQADLARSQKEKWALAAGLAVLSGLAILFWRQRRKTQAANHELAKSNEEIAQKNQKLDLLMRELHHRVKNNLQLVSSLLRLQSRQIGDESAAAAIKAGQLRVEAMSLIHQRLYREEGISMVNMQEFTQDLLEKIAFAFGHQVEAMDVQIQFDPKELDVDKAMPLSLILNELLTNSFKYAFGKTARPAIFVQLSKNGAQHILHYSDNGLGLSENTSSTGSFGSKLIASLSGQLGGQARQWSDGGAHFELIFVGS